MVGENYSQSLQAQAFSFKSLNAIYNTMEMNNMFKEGLWNKEINVADFVQRNLTPYEGDASFLAGPTERTKKVWNECLKALQNKTYDCTMLTFRSASNVEVIMDEPADWTLDGEFQQGLSEITFKNCHLALKLLTKT